MNAEPVSHPPDMTGAIPADPDDEKILAIGNQPWDYFNPNQCLFECVADNRKQTPKNRQKLLDLFPIQRLPHGSSPFHRLIMIPTESLRLGN